MTGRIVWVVEMFIDGKWLPTVECGLSRTQGLFGLRDRRLFFPNKTMRLRKYAAVPETSK